ncbi:DUF1904 family protein [Spiroplasma diminutum]|uniref:Uncharacterized protein n=1 Tax=Spiroplasma diminutum CUAS-1 TaxID=1276221 RepID=S5MIJ3_9MOLU|nr:DUF1904 family protein [Spiroplasma diminutum]AGR41720.1 hypothetical protein SDIMI_v3c00160 [Spiroplasma diminutum CUAS-1]
MPIFSFKGVDENQVKEYFKQVGELALMINADVKKFVFWHDPSVLVGNGYEKDAIQVNIEWVGRPLKQADVAKHIQKFFGNISKNVYVKFEEINSFLYLNGESNG